MSVEVRPYKGKEGVYEYDIKVRLPDGTEIRERKKSPVTGKEASRRWAAQREHELYRLAISGELKKQKEIPTMQEFWPRVQTGFFAAKKLAKSSMRVKDAMFRNWLLPRWGDTRLDKITAEQIDLLTGDMLEELRPGSVRDVLIVLRSIFAAAKKWGLLKNPPQVDLPPKDEPVRNVFPPPLFEQLVEAAEQEGPEAHALVLLTGEAAMRIGEVIGLWWEAVDAKTGMISVKRNLYEGALGPTKGKRTRSFRLTPRVLAALKAIKPQRLDYVLTRQGENGPERWSSTHALTVLHRVFDRVGLPHMGPHALRHCATRRLALGRTPIHVIMKITGHKSLKVLQDYLEDMDADTDLAVQALESLATMAPGEMSEKGKWGAGAPVIRMQRKRAQAGL